ncbi:uncharacterized protein BXZ73DRAFT_89995 [Epithele typhae]|uniref:uncharacterized protein n=1 Tax=Epithele typhae TaxID=378194 RepID=UPI0020087864|nr:uncharacterized protein BXZ73DRAFT_89995 [Epithele typhae]KAH9932048.1 hypothetical protein BXZ73DRAFT_89995 [Epithele typhae]
MGAAAAKTEKPAETSHGTAPSSQVWWSNGTFFILVHIAARPVCVPRNTLVLAVVLWQAASMGITVGYHRLYSHRAFRATLPVRMFVAVLGASAFQGSIKWWCLRHRLHHRFTDDPRHDPYAATRGLLWSHMGWIFFKSQYERMASIDRDDLEDDIVVRLQHKYYVPLALTMGFYIPPITGMLWGDPVGAFIYGGLVSRLLIWHCTFLVNSLAHWDGLQPYSDENTSKSNFVLALLTCGEGNHNFHSFPHDYRSGPSPYDWDPSKWAIALLDSVGLASNLRRAKVKRCSPPESTCPVPAHEDGSSENRWTGDIWTKAELNEFVKANAQRCILHLGGYAVDVTDYVEEHQFGARATSPEVDTDVLNEDTHDANWAFFGGINKHSQAARRRMRRLRIAKVQ